MAAEKCFAMSRKGYVCARESGHIGCHEVYVDGDGIRWWDEAPDETTNPPCDHCGLRPGTITWGDLMAFTHGYAEKWCKICAATAQLKHAREMAAKVPELEAKLIGLGVTLDEFNSLPCDAILWHGPGHQSKAQCHLTGIHEIHETVYGESQFAQWRGDSQFTGVFDEPPTLEDE